MDHEDFSGSQFCSIWESFSSDECASGGSSLNLPELCNSPDQNDNCSWLPSSQPFGAKPSSTALVDLHHNLIDSFPSPSYHKSDPVSSPDSPLLLNFLLPQHQQQSCLQFDLPSIQLPRSPVEAPLNKPQGKPILKNSKTAKIHQESSVDERIKKERSEEQDEDSPSWKKNCPESRTKSSMVLAASSEERSTMCSTLALGPALNTDGKPRARRGSATDPQSVYARQRRERINERLRALQGLVPNGAKVDIVTMLEEAINYVKFLQLQVKLLSSDEHWMYAPTNYNGMNISLGMHLNMQSYLKIKGNIGN